MAIVVYSIPIIPISEKGAREARFFIKHSGNNTNPVTPRSDCVRVAAIPTLAKRLVMVSAKIILYDKFPNQQSMKQEKAMMADVDFPTVASHASEYDRVLVALDTLPMSPNVYADMMPMTAMRMVAGIMAEGAFPNIATPEQRANESALVRERKPRVAVECLVFGMIS